MVNPILIIAVPLGAAFLLPLAARLGRAVRAALFYLALLAVTGVAARWAHLLFVLGERPQRVFTAGARPPLSIELWMGRPEAALVLCIAVVTLAGALFMRRELAGARDRALVLLFLLGSAGIVMTRDLFNLFVFLEILSISSYALVAMDGRRRATAAAFKYAVAGGIASIAFLLGTILLYGQTGTLSIDGMAGGAVAGPALLLLFLALVIEMKQFPANGWALDVYEAAPPGVAALVSSAGSGAILFALWKALPLGGDAWPLTVAIVGAATFVFSGFMGLRQRNARRLLGYSSIGQMGLLLAGAGLAPRLGAGAPIVLGALFLNHLLAKAGLFWLAGIVGGDRIERWSALRRRPALLVCFGLFALALAGMPPFAGFWGKWSLVTALAGTGPVWMWLILLGSLLEAAYLLRWFGMAVRRENDALALDDGAARQLPVWLFALLALAAGVLFGHGIVPRAGLLVAASPGGAAPWCPFQRMVSPALFAAGEAIRRWPGVFHLPWLLALLIAALGRLPGRARGALVLVAVAASGALVVPQLTGLPLVFAAFFAGGGLLLSIALLSRREAGAGPYALAALMLCSLVFLPASRNTLQFFFAWEMMTLSSWGLVLRGRRAEQAALSYAVFSIGGAFLLLAGFAVAFARSGGDASLAAVAAAGPGALLPVAAGMLVKLAAIGVHVWAPGAYAEAEDDVTPLFSGLLSKAGVLGLALFGATAGAMRLGPVDAWTILGWIGALTAFFATLYAVFQEDAKRLLAWSSVGQVGYIVLGLAAMSHLGWMAALYHTVNHFLFKALLFLAIAGVVRRTGTRLMYEMGGLIKRMPFSFISVLIGIIALSGVPPLTGFGGKWLLYEALIERGWLLQTGVAFMASTVAFLYCFRLIHAVFLGQPKPRFRDVRPAPLALLVPQYLLIAGIMLFSFFPKLLLRPLAAAVPARFAVTLTWSGQTALSSLGHWNAAILMIMVMAIFALSLVWLMLILPRPRKVKQFNIVFAGERPDRPETTHYAWRFFAPYERAMAPLLRPLVRRFWDGVAEWAHTAGGALRQVYTGNAQTYAIFILLQGAILWLISRGVTG